MTQQSLERSDFKPNLNRKIGIWFIGIAFWLFGITDQSVALLKDGYLSGTDIVQLGITFFFIVSWLVLKPSASLNFQEGETR